MDFYGKQDVHKNQIQNAAVHTGTTFPTAYSVGQLFFNTVDKILYLRRPDAWMPFSMGDNASIPSGSIMVWTGTLATIPNGFSLCDGTNGKPDLYNRFVKGAGTGVDPGAYGGSSHNHNIGNHTHGIYLQTGHALQGGGAFNAVGGGPQPVNSLAHSHGAPGGAQTSSASGTTDGATTLPEYYEVAFIIKA